MLFDNYRIIDFFVPEHIDEDLSGIERTVYFFKIRRLIIINWILFSIIMPIALYRLLYITAENMSLSFVLAYGILLFVSNLYIKNTGDLRIGAMLILFPAYLILPIRIFYTGGIFAPNLPWIIALLVITAVLHSRKSLVVGSIYMCVLVIITHYVETPHYVTPIGLRTIIHLAAILTISLTLYYGSKINGIIFNKSKEYERENTKNLLIATLCHEINNPLSIVKMSMKVAIKQNNLDKLKDGTIALDRIVEILRKIQDLERENDLPITEYVTGESMVDLKMDKLDKEN